MHYLQSWSCADLSEYGTNNAKVVGSIPREYAY